jgi:hypothetical protein
VSFKVLVVGHAQHGKDTVCEEIAAATGLKNAGTTSVYLAKYVAAREGVDVDTAYANRRRSEADRQRWRQIGDEIRTNDPALLVREAFKVGEVTGGCRGLPEITAVRSEGLADLIVWVDASPRVGPDSTMEFGPEWADVVLLNSAPDEHVFRSRVYDWATRTIAPAVLGRRYRNFCRGHATWSSSQFGRPAARGIEGALRHMEKEIEEVRRSKGADVSEVADLMLLLNDVRFRAGWSINDLLTAAEEKLEVNRNREWPAPTDPNAPVEHVR